jgi:hypothetical protein
MFIILTSLLFLALDSGVPCKSFGAEVSRYLEPVSLQGSIYKDSTNSPALFTFRRMAHTDGGRVIVSREYLGPDGGLAAKESVEYNKNQLLHFALNEIQIHASGSAAFVRTPDGRTRIDFEYTTQNRRKKTASETESGAVLVNDTLPAFIADQWESLLRGERPAFHYLIIPRLETIEFTLQKIGGDNGNNVTAEIEMRPASWFLQKLVDLIVFTVETKPPHRILRYRGRTTPKISNGGSWKDFDALTVFQWQQPGSAAGK